jgi:segregation and condensation protein B
MLQKELNSIIISLLLSSAEPLSIRKLNDIINDNDDESLKEQIKDSMISFIDNTQFSQIWRVINTAAGFKIIIKPKYNKYIAKMLVEKPPNYSPAFLETLSIIAYKQPVTRADIEGIRGVGVSSGIIKTLKERNWIKVMGFKDVPGKPALLGTTDEFLNYFNLKSLADMPQIKELPQQMKI